MSKKTESMRVNRTITSREVRVIKSDGEQAGILSLNEALALAAEEGLDLVEIVPNSEPPVCKVMNYGKFRFQNNKKLKDAKHKQKQIQIKEIKFKPRIDEHDYQTKVRHIRKFVEHGDKVRAFVHFRGREMVHRELGLKILERVIAELEDTALVEKRPSMEGNQMSMFLVGKNPVVRPRKESGGDDDEPEDDEIDDSDNDNDNE